jgi:hypothetical protein
MVKLDQNTYTMQCSKQLQLTYTGWNLDLLILDNTFENTVTPV